MIYEIYLRMLLFLTSGVALKYYRVAISAPSFMDMNVSFETKTPPFFFSLRIDAREERGNRSWDLARLPRETCHLIAQKWNVVGFGLTN